MVRIIAGSRRGMRLQVPKGHKTRPTADRTKETVFNIVGERVIGALVLDLFAGSGSLGLEALSRGAERAVFVDWDRGAIDTIRANIEKTSLADYATVLRARLPNLAVLSQERDKFDLVFMDPPFDRNLIAHTLMALDKAQLVAEGGTVIVEHSTMEELPSELKNLKPLREKRFGEARITFLQFG